MAGITAKEAKALINATRARGRRVEGELPKEKKPSKYRNRIVENAEGRFHSELEYFRWVDLCDQQRQGEIANLRRQVPYDLYVKGVHVGQYIADAVYDRGEITITEDAKGCRTAKYRLQKRLMLACHGITISEYPPRARRRKRQRKEKANAKR